VYFHALDTETIMLVSQITSCDKILANMEEMLGKFQSDLGNISSEIRALQEQSQSMSIRLRNRKAAEAKLGAFLDNLVLPPPLIDGILLAPPDAGFAVCIGPCPWPQAYQSNNPTF
jgi:hypothetical protein